MTRYDDMMQKMTVEEMVSLITQQPCRRCIWGNGDCNDKTCALGVEGWLMEEKDIKAQGGIHAHWNEDEYGFYSCSNCGYEWDEAEYKTKYCPECGAKMDEQENGAEDES